MNNQLAKYLPDSVKSCLSRQKIHLFVIDAITIGKEIGLNSKISTILQAAFFAVSGLLPARDAKQWMSGKKLWKKRNKNSGNELPGH